MPAAVGAQDADVADVGRAAAVYGARLPRVGRVLPLFPGTPAQDLRTAAVLVGVVVTVGMGTLALVPTLLVGLPHQCMGKLMPHRAHSLAPLTGD